MTCKTRCVENLNSIRSKVIIQGKLFAVTYTLHTYWNQFSLGGICKQENMHQCLFNIRGGQKHLILIILIIHIIVSYDQNISLVFYVKDRSHVRLWHLSCVYITAQRQYTAVQKMRTALKSLSLYYNLD